MKGKPPRINPYEKNGFCFHHAGIHQAFWITTEAGTLLHIETDKIIGTHPLPLQMSLPHFILQLPDEYYHPRYTERDGLILCEIQVPNPCLLK